MFHFNQRAVPVWRAAFHGMQFATAFQIWLLAICATLPITSMAQSRAQTYGPAIQFDVLNNQQVAEVDVDYRFRAEKSEAVQSFIWYDIFRGDDPLTCDGYACGTGGKLEICIYADDASDTHLWTGKPLSCVIDATPRQGEHLRSEHFDAPPHLLAGRLYHLHWHNSDPNPARNFVSVDDICVWHPTSPRQPAIPDTDLAVLVGSKTIETDSPIFQLTYADGTTQGQGYKESWNYMPEHVSGPLKVREVITVSEHDREVIGVSVRLNRISGEEPITVTLLNASGEVIDRSEIFASAFPVGKRLTSSALASRDVIPTWGRVQFKTPHRLAVGEQYQLTLSAPASTVYQAYGIQRASAYNFSRRTFFADGHGEYSRDDGVNWTGFRQTEVSVNHTDADIQFYFTLAAPNPKKHHGKKQPRK